MCGIPPRRSYKVGEEVSSFSVSPDSNMMAYVGRCTPHIVSFALSRDDKENIVAEFTNDIPLRVNDIGARYWTDVKWNSFMNYLAVADTSGEVRIFDLTKTEVIQKFAATRSVNSLCWNPKVPSQLLIASQDGKVSLCDFSTGKEVANFPWHKPARAVDFSPFFARAFAVAYDDGQLVIWDTRKPEIGSVVVRRNFATSYSLHWSKRKNVVVTGGADKMIHVWNMESTENRPIQSIETIDGVWRARFHPGSEKRIVSCAKLLDHSCHVWNVKSPYRAEYTISGHADVVTCVDWLCRPGSDIVLSSTKSGYLCLCPLSEADDPSEYMPRVPFSMSSSGDVAVAKKSRMVCVSEKVTEAMTWSDKDQFAYRAKNYVFSLETEGVVLSEALFRNAQVAAKSGDHNAERVFAFLSKLLSKEKGRTLFDEEEKEDMVRCIFEHHCREGDIQTCVVFTMLLGDLLEIPKLEAIFIIEGYRDILIRCHLYLEAQYIAKYSPYSEIPVSMKFSVGVPSKPEKCMCCVCRIPVRGLYVFCPLCQAGGHLSHISQICPHVPMKK